MTYKMVSFLTNMAVGTPELTISTFHNYLNEEIKARGQKVTTPEPSQAIVIVHNILAGSGFDVAPVVYVDRKKREVTYGVLEIVVRPDYTDGTQMYYSNPDEDPLAQILERGRTGREHRIAVSDCVRHVPTKSRFAVSWVGIHNFVVPEVIDTISHLKEQVTQSGIVFRVPTEAEFASAAERYSYFVDANSQEWFYDSARFGFRRAGVYGDGRAYVIAWPPGSHHDNVGFRLQAVSPPQKLP